MTRNRNHPGLNDPRPKRPLTEMTRNRNLPGPKRPLTEMALNRNDPGPKTLKRPQTEITQDRNDPVRNDPGLK